jgi:putative ABC transport system permease protein
MILLSFLVLIISGLANGLSNTNASSIFEIKAENIPRYKEEQGTLTMIIAFSLVITSLLIVVFFYVITLQKTQQLGVLKVIGTKNSYLAYDLVVQAVFLSVVALLVGTGLTLAFVQFLFKRQRGFL